MRPLRVVKADPVVDDPFGLKAVGDLVQIHSLLLQGPPEPFDENVVQIPSSAIEILISALVRVVIQSAPVYWLPCSTFIISGFPYLAMAAFSASTQKLASRVFESRQYTTLRIAQSRIATSYRKPFLTGM